MAANGSLTRPICQVRSVEYPGRNGELSRVRRCRVRLPYLTLVLSSTLTIPLFAIAAVIAVVGQIFILRDALAGRTPAASNTPAGRAREIIWIALPALTLALLLVATWRAIPPRAPVFTPTSNPGIPATPPAARMPTAGA